MSDDASALALVLQGDPTLYGIVRLSLLVSLSATALAGLVGFPLGAFLALVRFPGRAAVIVVLNAFMGLPPVVVGLAVFLLLSRSGPLGSFGLLFSAGLMVFTVPALDVELLQWYGAAAAHFAVGLVALFSLKRWLDRISWLPNQDALARADKAAVLAALQARKRA